MIFAAACAARGAGMAAAAAIISRKHRSYGYQYNTRSRYDDEDGPNLCWLTLFGMLGIGLIGFGAWYAYDSFEDPRVVAIRPYNTAVEAWNTVHRSEFADTSFEWRMASPEPQSVMVEDADGNKHPEVQFKAVDPAASTAEWKAMVQAMVPEPLAPDQNKEGILSYEPLRWEARGVLPANPPGHLETGADGNAFWTGPQYQIQLRTRTKDGKESVFDLEAITPMKEVPVPANQKMCRLHHANNYHDHRCWDRVAIAQVCLRLNHTSDGWKAPEGMQRGCAAGAELAFSRSCPGSMMAGRNQLGENPGCDFSSVTFTVRSVDDPHLIAQALTAGTLNFGYTPHENWVSAALSFCSLLRASRAALAPFSQLHAMHICCGNSRAGVTSPCAVGRAKGGKQGTWRPRGRNMEL